MIKRRIRDSELARDLVGEPERFAYGPAEIERLDIYRTRCDAAPIFVFIHGGPWRSGRSKDFATPAEMFLAAGAHYVVPDFAWVQDIGGSLMVLADQVRRAIAWVYDKAAHLGGDPNQLYVGGQSSGGHLAAVALTRDWPRDFGLPPDLIKGGMCVSGMYDLTPVRLSARSNYVEFDDATVAALSPIRHLDRLRAPLIVAYGTSGTPEFQRQNRVHYATFASSHGLHHKAVAGLRTIASSAERRPVSFLEGDPMLTASGAICAAPSPLGRGPDWMVTASYRKCGMICSMNTFM